MSTTPQIDSNLAVEPDPIRPCGTGRTAVTDFPYREPVIETKTSKTTPKKVVAQLATFRALSRQVFGAQAGQEYVAEAILFVCMMVVAAWPLSVTLNMLGTMYISPPNALR